MTPWNKSTPPNGARELLRSMEGDKLRAYLDGGGTATIGTGSTFMPDGSRVHAGQTITQAQDDALLNKQIMQWVPVIARCIRVDLTHAAAAVLVSFVHQEGTGALPGSVLADMINGGMMERAGRQLNGWVVAMANGVHGPVLGIMRRMETQRQIFLGAPLEPTKTQVWALGAEHLLPLYQAACADATRYRNGAVTWEAHPPLLLPAHPALAKPGQSEADALMDKYNATTGA